MFEFIGFLVLAYFGFKILRYLFGSPEKAYERAEKKWIDQNSTKVLSIVVPNDIPVFGSTGAGVFFDFVDYFVECDDLVHDGNNGFSRWILIKNLVVLINPKFHFNVGWLDFVFQTKKSSIYFKLFHS